MKRILATFMMVLTIGTLSQAQIKLINQDTTAKADFYAGYLGGTEMDLEEDIPYRWFNSVRVAASGQWNLSDKLYVRGFGATDMYQFGDVGVSAFGVSWISYTPVDWLTVETGNMPSSISWHFRPYAVSSSGQFEFLAQSVLPGSDLGAKVIINKSFIPVPFEFNIMKRDGYNEYQTVVGPAEIQAGLVFSEKSAGGVIKYNDNGFYLLANYQIDRERDISTTGLGVFWTFDEAKGLSVLADVIYAASKLEWCEVGFSKSISFDTYKPLNSFIALSAMYSQTLPSQLRIAYMVTL